VLIVLGELILVHVDFMRIDFVSVLLMKIDSHLS